MGLLRPVLGSRSFRRDHDVLLAHESFMAETFLAVSIVKDLGRDHMDAKLVSLFRNCQTSVNAMTALPLYSGYLLRGGNPCELPVNQCLELFE